MYLCLAIIGLGWVVDVVDVMLLLMTCALTASQIVLLIVSQWWILC